LIEAVMKNQIVPTATAMEQPFEILVAYEDVSAGKRAKELCDRLNELVTPACAMRLGKFDMLTFPAAMRLAAQTAAQCKMFIVTTHAGEELPRTVKGLLQVFVRNHRCASGAIVAQLLEDSPVPGGESEPVYSWLRRLTRRAGTDLFVQVAAVMSGVTSFVEHIQERATRQTTILNEILGRSRISGGGRLA
jgi:hypothetical protein